MAKEKLLEVIDLQTQFYTEEGIVKAVDKISFTLFRGETLGIVGESGSGKSVTSLSIMQLIAQPPGRIVGGEILYYPKGQSEIDLLKLTDKEMQRYRGNELAMIFQEPMTSLNPVFRCGDQVTEAIILHQKISTSEAKKRTIQLFEKVQLPDPERIFNAYPHQLSGGQKQRIMIAMAMSCNPDVLIADEPTTALDVTVQKAIIDLMNDLKSEMNASIIFITHDLGVISEIADHVIVMFKGKIVEQGDIGSIFLNPQHPYTKGLLACRPPLDFRLKKLPVVSDFMDINKNDNGELFITEKINNITEITANNKVDLKTWAKRQKFLSSQKPILEIKNLETWFSAKKNFFGRTTDWVKAVDDVSFKVFPGETLGLVGESGCGKTTLGRTILRLIEAKSGEIIFEGKKINDLSKEEMRSLRKDMQIIFQDPYSSLNPRMTIGNAIMEPMQVHEILTNDEERKARVIELLETVSLEAKHFNRYPHEFSGGQRQRICIARALALNPKFIICDESVSALDVSVQAQVLNLLMELREKFQFTYIFISHDLSVVKFMSDRMIVMNQGKIEDIGDADEIYNNPKTKYTRDLIEAIPKGKKEDLEARLGGRVT
ncbi:MAG: ABC transporter ATP-binding protein [Saprospiraceae bacterium]|jgi:peptide/nickel transport system ATP-binding protein|nr:ABC transporter ATP-binding protein [Saprospiraceae bacterium]